ncbi:unnamed protein product [Lampetra fluviatilis]
MDGTRRAEAARGATGTGPSGGKACASAQRGRMFPLRAQAGRDIAGDEGPCSEDACQVCGTFEPCSPSDPAAGTVTGQAQD